jgi:hypothetical protein
VTQQFEPATIVEVLNRHGVLYVLLGGYAAQIHGAHRPTNDLDIAPSNQLENLDRLATALRELGAGIRVDDSDTGLPFSCTAESLRGMHMLNLRTRAGDLDLTFAPAGFGNGYADLEPNAVSAVIGSITIKVAELNDVIKSKTAAARPKDLDALPELVRLAKARDRTRRPPRRTNEIDDDRGPGL